jgi:hypothetical protein
MLNKEDINKKWAPIVGSIGLTGSRADWMSQYAEMQSNQNINCQNLSELQKDDNKTLDPILPLAMKIAARTIGNDLVTVQPLSSPGGMSEKELERIKSEIKQKNRDNKIESLLEDKEFKEVKVEEHPDFNTSGLLFYLDYKYNKN